MVKFSAQLPGEAESDDPTCTHFTHKDAFFGLLEEVLAWDLSVITNAERDRLDRVLVDQLGAILDEYLSLPPLLDPHLHDIIPPLVSLLSAHIQCVLTTGQTLNAELSPPRTHRSNLERLHQIGRLLNWITKVRGRKTVTAHYPSDIIYLGMLIEVLKPRSGNSTGEFKGLGQDHRAGAGFPRSHYIVASPDAWELRSVLLMWLGMLMTVPFDLRAFDVQEPNHGAGRGEGIHRIGQKDLRGTSGTAMSIQEIAKPLLCSPSQEGTLAALLLARLFARSDSSHLLSAFLAWTTSELTGTSGNRTASDRSIDNTIFMSNILNLTVSLPGLITSASPSTSPLLAQIQSFREEVILPASNGFAAARISSTRLRKMEIKAEGRWWIARLGGAGVSDGERARVQRKKRLGQQVQEGENEDEVDEADFDPPHGFEEALDRLLSSLSDRDTIVRYSAAKYTSRLAILLPRAFGLQIASAVISLFEDQETPTSNDTKGKKVDLGGGNEHRWHGICLAVAELARRGLINGELTAELLPWVIKALSFDVRRGAHSVGSNVRDAACYVVWSLARASTSQDIAPSAQEMAQKLVVTACYDREVNIRRAASAAFQEHIGRMGLFPHGIDVLGKTDFYSVSIRRTAFLIAGPAVACHDVYRTALLAQLHLIVLRHWDAALRDQGAQSLRLIVQEDATGHLASQAMEIEKGYVNSADTQSIHGAVLALTQLACLFRERQTKGSELEEIMGILPETRATAFTSFGSDALLEATCDLITAATTAEGVADARRADAMWRILDWSMKSRTESVQLAAARAVGAISIKTGRPAQKQSFAAALGEIDYGRQPLLHEGAVSRLLANLDTTSQATMMDIETRKASITSLATILDRSLQISVSMTEDLQKAAMSVLEACCAGMNDYSTDQRGDVGSWVRMASAAGSATVTLAIHGLQSRPLTDFDAIISKAIAGLLKQVMEKMDNVRQVAGLALEQISAAIGRDSTEGPLLTFSAALSRLLPLQWAESEVLYSSVIPLLRDPFARDAMLDGLFLTLGSKNQRTSRAAQAGLLSELRSTHGDGAEGKQLVLRISERLATIAGGTLTSNRILVPVLQTGSFLVNEGIAKQAASDSEGQRNWARLIGYAGQGMSWIKNIERLTAAMNLVISAVAIPALRGVALAFVPAFLGHAYPRIRSISAEHLYLILQDAGQEVEELDEILLETDWTGNDLEAPLDAAMRLLRGVE